MELNCITAASTVVVAVATVVAAAAATWYARLTNRLISEQRDSQLNDKFPCLVVRSRLMPSRRVGSDAFTRDRDTLRLVNIGRGPAFIDYFETTGLDDPKDGVHTHKIDKVIGPDVGDPDLHVEFGWGEPEELRSPDVTMVIRYHDIAGRSFQSGIREGSPFYEPPESLTRILG